MLTSKPCRPCVLQGFENFPTIGRRRTDCPPAVPLIDDLNSLLIVHLTGVLHETHDRVRPPRRTRAGPDAGRTEIAVSLRAGKDLPVRDPFEQLPDGTNAGSGFHRRVEIDT